MIFDLFRRRQPAEAAGILEIQRQLIELQGTVERLKIRVEGLPSLWQEERERAESAYGRARAAKSDAKRIRDQLELEEDERAAELQGRDAGAGASEGVPPVRARVAPESPAQNPLAEMRKALLLRQMGRR